MTIQQELASLIKNDVLIEIEEMRDDFLAMIQDIDDDSIDDEEAKEIIDEINEMRKED